MTRPLLLALLIVVAAPSARAQANTLVIPRSYATAEAPGVVFWAISPFAARRQILLGDSHLATVQARTLRGIDLRRNGGTSDPLLPSFVHVEITLSHSPRSADAPSATLADNRGPDATVVYSGIVAMPSSPVPTGVPTWVPPDGINIVFQQPFTYQGGTLCIETLTTEVTQPQPTNVPWWPIDGYVEQGRGVVTSFGTSCITGTRASADPASLVLGSSAVWSLQGPLTPGSGALVFGTNSLFFGGLALPFELRALGAPGCFVNIDWVIGVGAAAQALPNSVNSLAKVAIPLPVDATLAGQDLHVQWLWPTVANPLGMAFSEGVRTTLATPSNLMDASWIEAADITASTGEILRGRLPVMRLRL